MNSNLAQKIQQSKFVIEDALSRFAIDESVIAWSAGKDSTLMLYLIREVCQDNHIELPAALDIDQKDAFDTLTSFRDQLVEQWQLDLQIVANSDVLQNLENIGDVFDVQTLNEQNRAELDNIGYKQDSIRWEPDSPVCNHLLKTVPIKQFIEDKHVRAMFTGIRWDEHSSRDSETFFSHRSQPDHTRVHPLLHFSERDIWDATFALGVPFAPLYQLGYRSLGTRHGTQKSSDIPAWEQDLDMIDERSSRSSEKEKVMDQLRAWGYI